ncbi:MAG: DUF1684 domain-containing protein, partial [Chitinophagia bacterium]|nr:DUF1684 domain-containing protein [Chitinophagia bacterium]
MTPIRKPPAIRPRGLPYFCLMRTRHGSFKDWFSLIALVSLSTSLCAQTNGRIANDSSLLKEEDTWHAHRLESLRAEDGWLNLAGLFWLREGDNSFGSGTGDELRFPEGRIPAKAGILVRKGFEVRLLTNEASGVKVDGQPVREAVVFDTGAFRTPVLSCGSLRWTIIRRSERLGVRLRDLDHPALKSFTGVERYPVDRAWLVLARLERNPFPKSIPISNVLGQTNLLPSPGRLIFTLQGSTYGLDALEEGEELFILFGDETNG